MTSFSPDRLDELVNAWLDGSQSDAEQAEFEAALVSDHAARLQFWELASLHGIMAEATKLRWGIPGQAGLAGIGDLDSHSGTDADTPQTAQRRALLLLPESVSDWLASIQFGSPRVLAACVVFGLCTYFASLLLAIAWQRAWQAERDQRLAGPRATNDFAAADATTAGRLVLADRCRWAPGSPAPAVGDRLATGRLQLVFGNAEIEFTDGARVRISGPTEFELKSGALGFLREGKLSARVSGRARGFTIDTPTARVVDLGTAFVIEVNGAAETKMAVTEGVVEVLPAEFAAEGPQSGLIVRGAHRVTAGQAMTVLRTDSGTVVAESRPFDAEWVDRNSPPGELVPSSRVVGSNDPYYRAVTGTPGLVAYWRLSEAGGQIARDEVGGSSTLGGQLPGIYHNMQASDFGRPGALSTGPSTAVRLHGTNYVEVNNRREPLIDDWKGLTLAAWIKPESVDSAEVRLIAGAWARAAAQDQCALWLSKDRFGFVVADGTLGEVGVPSAGRWPVAAGQWSFVVGTWEKQSRAEHFYINGHDDTPAEGALQKGWGINAASTTAFCIGSEQGKDRFFSGLIAEVAVFQRCLEAEEVARIYGAAIGETPSDGKAKRKAEAK